MPDRVYAAMDGLETTRVKAPIDGVLSEAENEQLPTRDDPVLTGHERIGVGFPSHSEG